MNMGMVKQLQKIQKDMMKAQDEVYSTIFEGESSFVKVKVNGKKEVIEIKIDSDSLDKDDVEMLQDMLVVALNEAFGKADKMMEQKLGPYTKGMPGLF